MTDKMFNDIIDLIINNATPDEIEVIREKLNNYIINHIYNSDVHKELSNDFDSSFCPHCGDRHIIKHGKDKQAGFPFSKAIEDYDFDYQPSVKRKEIEDFRSLRFIENNENILFIVSPGVGKTHLATSIGIEAARHRYSVYFIICQDLMSQLKKAESENRLEQRLKAFNRHKLLIIDEIGYINLDRESANLFFQLISMRYEQKSTIITTNKNLSKWTDIFCEPVIANAILDRLLHHSHIANIIGPSYRTKDVIDAQDD